MCGIFGSINYRIGENKHLIFKKLGHRGPDEQNYFTENEIEFIHTRLAIQDLTPGGRQPMHLDGVYITYNGELYNHLELREKYGLHSTIASDTMTILMLYQLRGMDMLEEFDGMFAFAIYDSNKRKLFLARDRVGKKPLYIWNSGKQFVFSSELGALYQVVHPETNIEAISDYLYLGYFYRKDTPYRMVRELDNGTFMEIDLTSYDSRATKWFDISTVYKESSTLSLPEALDQLDHKLRQSIRRRIESSDLEVGTFLSGGIDSGLVTSIATEYTSALKTFTVSMPGAYDESALALQVAKKYQTNHTEISISFDELAKDFEGIISNYGEPFFDSSAIPSYYVSREAKKHITVVLNGDGADELFGGYRRYVPFTYFNFFSSGALVKNLAGALSSILPVAHEKKNKYNFVYRLLKLASYRDIAKVYNAATTDLLVGFEDAFIIKPQLLSIREMLNGIEHSGVSPLKKILQADFNAILFSDLLPKMDIATMSHSLEGRSPFLSKEIVEFAPMLSDNLKINGSTTKYLLRNLAKRYLPEQLISQPKRGFEIPLKNWMDNDLKGILNDMLSSSDTLYTQFIEPRFVKRLLDRKITISDEKRAKILYAILCLEIWYRTIKN
ncbi:asparagine synthase (glutamine-hydrolyzing) [Chitinophaga tropicalis]|uniref:asparagine synthase (glutamine-hydrolyzing) n=1 Tax=Chitinophaga tropicalis TaxID=2683588 RepID=A0A7K1U3E1_9BACT|nr:asparagine synthase (glutamine-hydrolyzing) [Chitinophaga tropicalis]MVT08884.1 asparagine synthase (glutamine-hydrolyzing) [Chitinophaga tropicalis]